MKRHKATMRAEQKKAVNAIPFPDIDLAEQLKITNEILIKKVEQQQIISELQNSPSKQNFAREGLKIHEHKDGEKCGFCGNEISEERWILLEKYFNEEVKNFEDTIKTVIDKLDEKNSTLDNMPEIDERLFYEQFSEKIKSLTSQIKNIKNDYKTFLNSLKTALEEKKREIFSASTELTFSIPQNFDVVKNEYEKIVDENNIFSQNLQTEQENAKNTLRLHEVKVALEEFKYDVEKNTLDKLESQKNETQKELNEKKQESEIKKTVKKGLIDQTKDRSKLAIEINNLLKTMGVLSFSLELVSDSEGQKGQYQIKGHNNDIRTIDKLSKGEKNIIAFLYFIFSIEAPTEDTKPKLIIFDDPMTSNDDTMQYLMTEQIRKLYSKINNSKSDYFILLTHNLHFYLNVRPNYNEVEENKILQRNRRQSDDSQKEKTFYEKSGYFILKNNGTHTTIQSIEDYNMDHKTSYSALWNDLIFLYNNDKPVSMLNNCRRIIETYIKFNKIEKKFYENNEFVRKLFNVNSHSIDDQENELNGKTKDEIKIMLHEAFKKNNVEDHFKAYWILSSNQEDDE
jgi:wobble nucleotide-excising tRNase